VLLEQNVLMGKANRFLLKRAERVYANFPCTNAADESRIRVAGNPIRSELLEGVPARDEAVRRLGLEPGTFTLLFMGGSQGARAVNEIALELVPALKTGEPIPFQVIHLAGEVMCGRLREFYRELGIRAFCEAFTDRMKTVYAASDLAVTRAGGGSLSELLHFGVPPIMIPFPFAAENHQEANARYLEECGCGFAVPQCECDSKALAVRIREWIRDPGLLAPVKKKHETLRFQKSAEAIAGDCVSVMRRFAENSAGNNAGETA
jgi:UDP-N-acetylglucosamine--N-acetylmuramyl-(pentapeptide) pyrophosphoryl-undecaprenol N-acetylglucosamine transferase